MTSEPTLSEDLLRCEIDLLKALLNRWLGEEDWMNLGEPDVDGNPTFVKPDLSGHDQLVSDTIDAVTPETPDVDDFDLPPETVEVPCELMCGETELPF